MAEDRAAEREKAAFSVAPEVQPEGAPTKKPFLERRGLAAALAALAIIGGTLFGTHRSLAAERRSVERQFSTGVLYEGYSIESDLSDRTEYAGILVKIARQEGYDSETAAVTAAIEQLNAARNPHEKYAANRALTDAVETLAAARTDSDGGRDKFREYYSNFTSSADTIAREAIAYNELVAEFNEKALRTFPNGMLARLTGVKELEAYR